MADLPDKGDSFISEFIPKVSRTFALAIKFLPENLRHPVYSAYLLCRLADTIEDSPQLDVDEKSDRLKRLQSSLNTALNGGQVSKEEILHIQKSIDFSAGFDHQLLGKATELFEILDQLPAPQRNIIYRWAAEMAGGMAEFSVLTGGKSDGITALKDLEQWDRYCYYVAGTVGHMLTELFILELNIENEKALDMNRLCNSFGLGLQKVNTIKDAPDDRKRGVIFLPLELMKKNGLSPEKLNNPLLSNPISSFVGDLTEAAYNHLDDAVKYSALFPESFSGVRMFLIVPIFLAAATLNAVNSKPLQTMSGPPVKISRAEVARLTVLAGVSSVSNHKLAKEYARLRNRSKVDK